MFIYLIFFEFLETSEAMMFIKNADGSRINSYAFFSLTQFDQAI